jgi:hypothetical protein
MANPLNESSAGPYAPDPLSALNARQEQILMFESLKRVVANSPQANAMTLGTATLAAGGNYQRASELLQRDAGAVLRDLATAAVMTGGVGQNPGAVFSGFHQAMARNPAMAARIGVGGPGLLTNAMAEAGTIELNRHLFSGLTGGANRSITQGFGATAVGGMIAEHGARGMDFSKFFNFKDGPNGSIRPEVVEGSMKKLVDLLKDTSRVMAAVTDMTGSRDMSELFRQAERLTGQSAAPGNLKKMLTTVTEFRNSMAGSGLSSAEQYAAATRHGDVIGRMTGSAGFGAVAGMTSLTGDRTQQLNMQLLASIASNSGFTMTAPTLAELQSGKTKALAGILENPGEGAPLIDAIAALSSGDVTVDNATQLSTLIGELEAGGRLTPDQRIEKFAKIRDLIPAGRGLAGKYGTKLGLESLSDKDKARFAKVAYGVDRAVSYDSLDGPLSEVFGEGSALKTAVPFMMANFDPLTNKSIVDALSSGRSLDFQSGTTELEREIRDKAGKLGIDPAQFAEFSQAISAEGSVLNSNRFNRANAVAKEGGFFSAGNAEADMKMRERNHAEALARMQFSGSSSLSGMVNDDTFVSKLLQGYHGVATADQMGSSAIQLMMHKAQRGGAAGWEDTGLAGIVNSTGGLDVDIDQIDRMREAFRQSDGDLLQTLGLAADADSVSIKNALAGNQGFDKVLAAMTGHGMVGGIDKTSNKFRIAGSKEADGYLSELQKRQTIDTMAPAVFGSSNEQVRAIMASDKMSMSERIKQASALDPTAAGILEAMAGGEVKTGEGQTAAMESIERYTQSLALDSIVTKNARGMDGGEQLQKMLALAATNGDVAMTMAAGFANTSEKVMASGYGFDAYADGTAVDKDLRKEVSLKSADLAKRFKELAAGGGAGGQAGGEFTGRLLIENPEQMAIQLRKR